MYKRLCLFAMLLLGAATVSAQQEIYFNDTNIAKKDIQIDKTLNGISLRTDVVNMIGDMHRQFNINFDYFHEDRIAPTMTMYSFAGVQNELYQDRYIYDGPGGLWAGKSFPMHTYYNLHVHAGTEWRWYFNYRQRYIRNQRTTAHTGWFVAVPLTASLDLLSHPRYPDEHWLPDQLHGRVDIAAKIGYRHAFSEHWFIEVAFAYIPAWLDFWGSYGFGFDTTDELKEMFRLELKVAYVFD